MAHKDQGAGAMMTTMATEMKKKEERANNGVASILGPLFNCGHNGELEYINNLVISLDVSASKIKMVRKISLYN